MHVWLAQFIGRILVELSPLLRELVKEIFYAQNEVVDGARNDDLRERLLARLPTADKNHSGPAGRTSTSTGTVEGKDMGGR